MGNEENKNGKFSGIWQKASDLGKKAADGIQKGVKDISDKTKEEIHEQKLKKYNPVTAKEFKHKGFSLAKVIKIVSDEEIQSIDVCEGAIGWRDRSGAAEVLYLSYNYVKSSNIDFFPSASINEVYCSDQFDSSRYIQADSIFGKAHEERLAELERIAYMLGAKTCTVELVEGEKTDKANNAGGGVMLLKASAQNKIGTEKNKSGRTVTHFNGNNEPRRPELKWFKNDMNILALIDMRCSGDNSIKSRSLTIEGSTFASVSKNVAVAVDVLKKFKASASMERKAAEEHSSKLIFEVEF